MLRRFAIYCGCWEKPSGWSIREELRRCPQQREDFCCTFTVYFTHKGSLTRGKWCNWQKAEWSGTLKCHEERSRFHASLAAHLSLHTPEDEDDDLMLAPVYLPVSFKNNVFKEIRSMIQQSRRISWLLYRFSTISWIKLQSKMKFPTENPRKPGNWNPPPGRYISFPKCISSGIHALLLILHLWQKLLWA